MQFFKSLSKKKLPNSCAKATMNSKTFSFHFLVIFYPNGINYKLVKLHIVEIRKDENNLKKNILGKVSVNNSVEQIFLFI
jgi:hypothetical protein